MIEQIIQFLIHLADSLGYFGIYLYMLLVGTFIPVPSEIILIPSGYLASIGQKNFFLLLISGAFGSLSGALINYYLAKWIIRRYKDKKIIQKTILFFKHHGNISVFLAPLTPGLGQYISIPAGISHMPLYRFIPLTFLANIIWVGFMLLIGYIFGKGKEAHSAEIWFSLLLLGFVIVTATIYVFKELKKEKV
ncbi:DedA family protein [Nitrosophilus kaiyonis]|uniref:DedA family protein n=1 Tax=Nitrosophilus kaiyonis TaxID=2930200 RepID=UPI002490F364|nr:DedA family protein [Nitrosophilus kaiyonis]